MDKKELPKNYKEIARMLASPRLWGEHYLVDRDGTPRRYWDHQAGDLECGASSIIHLDGRDIGKCLPGYVAITDCDTGERIRIDQLTPGRRIAALGRDLRITTTRDYEVFESGIKKCFHLTTVLGRRVDATGNHPFLTERGWIPLENLKPNDWIAIPMSSGAEF